MVNPHGVHNPHSPSFEITADFDSDFNLDVQRSLDRVERYEASYMYFLS